MSSREEEETARVDRRKTEWGTGMAAVWKPRKRASGGPKPDGMLLWTFKPPNSQKINGSCLNHLVCGILLWWLQWTYKRLCRESCCMQGCSCYTEVTCLHCDCLETATLKCRVDLELLLPGGQGQAQVGLSDAWKWAWQGCAQAEWSRDILRIQHLILFVCTIIGLPSTILHLWFGCELSP